MQKKIERVLFLFLFFSLEELGASAAARGIGDRREGAGEKVHGRREEGEEEGERAAAAAAAALSEKKKKNAQQLSLSLSSLSLSLRDFQEKEFKEKK